MKLNYTDLRIGNMIYWPQRQSTPDEVHTVRPGDFVTFQKYRFELKGVPITEEWLMRAGFEDKSDYDYFYLYNQDHDVEVYMVIKDSGFCLGYYGEIRIEPMSAEIGFIHQLQNLYHALIGQELTFKK